jgi:flagellar motility protein MotE (MotC chaperone)
MIRVLQSSWMTVLVGGFVYLSVTLALIHPAQFPGVHAVVAEAVDKKVSRDEPSWTFHNPEFDQWVTEMKREKETLDLREQQLKEMEVRLESERQELTVVTQTVYQLQAEFDKNVIRIKEQDVPNLKRQAKVLSTMSPEAAAAVVSEMSEDDAVRVLFTMKTDEASAILETLSKSGKTGAKRAAMITEKLRRTLPPDPNAHTKIPS